MEIVSRSEAFRRNVKRYFTGTPCRRGHLSERFTSSGACLECMKKPTGLFVRISVEVHQDDRVALELFTREMLAARGRTMPPMEDVQWTADERHYRYVVVPRYRSKGAPKSAVPRGFGTFKLPDGEEPW